MVCTSSRVDIIPSEVTRLRRLLMGRAAPVLWGEGEGQVSSLDGESQQSFYFVPKTQRSDGRRLLRPKFRGCSDESIKALITKVTNIRSFRNGNYSCFQNSPVPFRSRSPTLRATPETPWAMIPNLGYHVCPVGPLLDAEFEPYKQSLILRQLAMDV